MVRHLRCDVISLVRLVVGLHPGPSGILSILTSVASKVLWLLDLMSRFNGENKNTDVDWTLQFGAI